MLSADDRKQLARNAGLKDRHLGHPAFVIGNGPSLVGVDLALLAGAVTFVSNAFWKHPIVEQWQPTYYSLVDPVFFDGSPAMRRFLADLRVRVPESSLLVPLMVHEPLATGALVDPAGTRADRTFYFAMAGSLADDRPAQLDATQLLPTVLNVAQFSIMVALYAGCSPIYLLGADHDWLAKPGLDRHFYEGAAGLESHPTLLKNQETRKYIEAISQCSRLWIGYQNLSALAAEMGVPVINLTEGSFLDVFPRERFSEVIRSHGDGTFGAPSDPPAAATCVAPTDADSRPA